MSFLPLGKLDPDHLERLLRQCAPANERVVVGPGVGEDAAVIDFGDRYLVVKTDPITFATDEIGWYVVNVNANDIAAMGAAPRWFLATILLPEAHTTPALVDTIFAQIDSACTGLGVGFVGGHTEITYDLNRPIVVGQMLGEVAKDDLVTTAGAKPGDMLLLTKGLGIEATAIIAREMEDQLAGRLSAEEIERAQQFLHDPGISVVRDAEVATSAGDVHAMHDPTEGGLVTGLHELAQAAGVGLVLNRQAVPIDPLTETLCQTFDLNPLGVIASGALVLAVAPADADAIVAALREAGIEAARVGEVWEKERGIKMWDGSELVDLPIFPQDEITRLF
ncbi:MAG: AIR synthase family protein [Anaerolineae bacterium]